MTIVINDGTGEERQEMVNGFIGKRKHRYENINNMNWHELLNLCIENKYNVFLFQTDCPVLMKFASEYDIPCYVFYQGEIL